MMRHDHRPSTPRTARLTAAMALLAALVLAALGCKSSEENKAPAAGGSGAVVASPGKAVRLGYFANLTHAQAVLGVASGDLARAVAPAKLDTKVFNAGPSLVEALFAGEIDVGYIGPGPTITAHTRSRGQGIRVIAGAASNGVIIVARPGSGIETMADLKGKKVATPQLGNTQDISARHYLQTVLGQTDLKNVIPVPNAEQAGMMVRGDIDAAWVPEPWGQRLIQEAGAKLIAEEKDLWPGKELGLTVLVASPGFLAAHRDVVEKVLVVQRAWTERLNEDPAGQLAALGEALFTLNGKKLPDGVLEAAIGRVKFTDEPPVETFTAYGTWTFDLGFERTKPDMANLVDTSILAASRGAK